LCDLSPSNKRTTTGCSCSGTGGSVVKPLRQIATKALYLFLDLLYQLTEKNLRMIGLQGWIQVVEDAQTVSSQSAAKFENQDFNLVSACCGSNSPSCQATA
jgi:hypothetical protein